MDVELRERRLPLSKPLETAAGRIDARHAFLVRIERGGVAGIGEATPLPGWTESLPECREALAEAIERLDDGGEDAGDDGDPTGTGPDPTGAMEVVTERPAARHGLTLAAADRAARAAGEPLYRHLGARRSRESVPVNATVGDGEVRETAAAAADAVEAGFGTVKVKVGARSVDEDVDRVRAVREAVGDDVVVRADANGAWSREAARAAFDRLEPLRVSYVEQPLPATDLAGLRSLRGRGVGVAVDETLGEYDLETVVAEDAADAAVLKPMAVGGPRRAVRTARLARNNGIDPVVTTTIDGVVARTAAVHCGAAVPSIGACGLATADRLARDLGPDPAPVSGGRIAVPQEPGLADRETAERWWSA